MDAFSAALSSVRMTGAIFADAICTAPWGFAVPAIGALERVVHMLAPGTERVVGYHLVTEGRALVGIEGSADVPLTAGDIVIIPHGDPHRVTNGAPSKLIDTSPALAKWLAGDVSSMELGGGGERTHFVCGYFGCERHAARLFLAGLPSLIKINLRTDAAGRWLENSIRHLLDEAKSQRPGGAVVLSKMAEAFFIETLRRYMQQLPPEQRGWLAGARDPVVGAALALLHRQPCHSWTLSELGAEIGASRSLVAERFVLFLGEPPLTYLVRWRLQLAARLLQTTQKTILQVAVDVGYESEAAFNRAFRREFDLPPAQYRRKLAGNGAGVRITSSESPPGRSHIATRSAPPAAGLS
jgi:AraC-like DNA-binding protein/mannose-6-phosphate isomerase-like protein (cupin superfamily)